MGCANRNDTLGLIANHCRITVCDLTVTDGLGGMSPEPILKWAFSVASSST